MTVFCRVLRKFYRQSQINLIQKTMDESGLAYIGIKENCNPFELFKEWLEESKTFGKFNTVTFNLATASRSGNVTNRTVVLADYKEDTLVFVTNENGKKTEQIRENPNVSACFFWSYENDKKFIRRQVRMEGAVEQLSNEECLEYYNKEPLFSKIRSHICQQGQEVNWNELKKKHDDLLNEIKTTTKELPMPTQQVAFKIIPIRYDFYFAWNNYIADRIAFIKQSGNGWEFHRIAA